MGAYGLRGENGCIVRIIFKVGKERRAEVFDALNKSLNGQPDNPGGLAENVTQCLRDCGMVPRKAPGRRNFSWKNPVDSTWEFSWEAFEHRQGRLAKQHAKKRKERADGPTNEPEEAGGAGARGGGGARGRLSKKARIAKEEPGAGAGSHAWA
eukprot:758430-Rhodomonas_salina.1